MSSSQKKITFIYLDKLFTISFTSKEKLNIIINKFIKEFNPNSKIIEYNCYYNRKKISSEFYEMTIEENPFFDKLEEYTINVEKNIKVIECPKCNYGDCVVSLMNYKTIFYNCEHKHLHESSYEKYNTDQIFYPERIICSGLNCTKTFKMDTNFYLCLTCSKLLGRTKSICTECKDKHKIEHKEEPHVIINYEDKNYYCKDHIKNMKFYCFQCKKNMCIICAKKHSENKEKKYNEHQIKSIDLLIPEEKEIKALKNSLIEIKKNLDNLQIVIDDLCYTLNGAMRIYKNYYDIAKSIIEKYESFNKSEKDFKNFTIFKCLRNLKFSNIQILEDLKAVINEKDKFDKAKTLIGIYSDKKSLYYNPEIGNDLNKEDDADWLKEVCKREKEKKEGENEIKKEKDKNEIKEVKDAKEQTNLPSSESEPKNRKKPKNSISGKK